MSQICGGGGKLVGAIWWIQFAHVTLVLPNSHSLRVLTTLQLINLLTNYCLLSTSKTRWMQPKEHVSYHSDNVLWLFSEEGEIRLNCSLPCSKPFQSKLIKCFNKCFGKLLGGIFSSWKVPEIWFCMLGNQLWILILLENPFPCL